MASYIDNIQANAAIKGPKPFVPDWAFLSRTQSQLSEMQRKGYESFRNQYSPLLNSNLTSPENIELRKQFKQQADQTIDRIAGMDLTDPRNVAAAKGVLQPLVNNQSYIHDVGFTRQAENALREASTYQYAADESLRSAYNLNSVKDIQYTMQDYAQADVDARLGFSAPAYVPGIDYTELAKKYFKEMDWQVQENFNIQSSGSAMGVQQRFIVKTASGEANTGDIYNYLMGRLQNDPLVQANLELEAKIGLRDYVESNLESYGGDRMAASIGYVQEIYNNVGDKVKDKLVQDNAYLSALLNTEKAIDSRPPSDNPVRLSYREKLKNTLKEQQAKVEESTLSLPANPTMKDINKAVRMYVNTAFQGDVINLSGIFGRSLGSKVEVKADPFSLESWKAATKAFYENLLGTGSDGLTRRGQRVALGIEAEKSEKASKRDAIGANAKTLAKNQSEALLANVDALIAYAELDGNVQYTNDNGEVISLKRNELLKLSPDKLLEYTLAAKTALTSGAYDLDLDDDVVTQAETVYKMFRTFEMSKNAATDLGNVEKQNLLNAIAKTPIGGGTVQKQRDRALSRELLTYIVDKENILDESDIEERYVQIMNNEEELIKIANENFGGLAQYTDPAEYITPANPGLAGLRRVRDFIASYTIDTPRQRFKEFWGDFSVLSAYDTMGDDNVRTMYYGSENNPGAVSLQGLLQGDDKGMGGLEIYATLLGSASNNRPNDVNMAIKLAQSSHLKNLGTVYIGNIPNVLAGDGETPEGASEVLRDLVTYLDTKTAKTSEQLAPVQVYENNDGKQFMNISLPDKFVDQLTGSESTKGYLRSQNTKLRREGITVALDAAAALPEEVFGTGTSKAEFLLNVNRGVYNFGGGYLDGGNLNLTRTDNGYSIRGSIFQYDPETKSYIEQSVGNKLTKQIAGKTAEEAFSYIEDVLTDVRLQNKNLERGK